ncbi:DUF397 domain-containing protein [Nocardia sp. NPDC005978]|uniref:DUF397 domain-containing protein n=1 Tax=Nocardia sp. NPDC005978 TaxID=3156725 RepID=UPI0033A41EEE
MATRVHADSQWFESSYSQAGGECGEVAFLGAGVVGVRDSKNPAGAALVFDSGAWDRFTADVAKGSFNLP